MSKVDAMQAMREARYARAANKTSTVPKPAVATPRRKSDDGAGPILRTSVESTRVDGSASEIVGDRPVVAQVEPTEEEALCGHRSMNNRLCKRPAGHSEKNHRYN